MIIELIKGIALLLALTLLQGLNVRIWRGRQPGEHIATGLLFGCICVVGMTATIQLAPGAIFDARSVVLSMAALFGGPLAGLIAGLIAGGYRLWLGGAGAIIGVMVTIASILLGLAYRHGRQRGWVKVGAWQLLLFGLLIHLICVLAFLTMFPAGIVEQVMHDVAFPFVLTLTPATALFGMLLLDIENRGRTETALKNSEAELSDITRSIPVAVYRYRRLEDGNPHLYFISDKVETLWGVSASAAMQDPLQLFARIHPDDLDAFVQADITATANKTGFSQNCRTVLADGSVRWLYFQSAPKQDADGITVWNGFIEDITERVKVEQALQESEARYRMVFQITPDVIMITRLSDGLIRDVNDTFEKVTGWKYSETIGKTSIELGLWHDLKDRERLTEAIQKDGYCRNLEAHIVCKNGTLLYGLLSAQPILFGGEPCLLSISRDITQRKAKEEEIRQLAFYDPLTQLPNRRLLLERLQHALVSCTRNSKSGALLFIDLDDFKMLNDTLGHDKGDHLLRQVALRMKERLREGDMISRLGGDEFVVMLEDLSGVAEEAAAQTKRVAGKLLGIFETAFDLDGQDYRTSASIGIALFDEQPNSIDELMKRADLAMYQAKAAGRNALRFFDPTMQAVITARVALETELRIALHDHHFQLFYQPQVDSTGHITGVEALLRWLHPQRGIIAPDAFIALAEETGIIYPLGRWVVETACAQLVAWAAQPERQHLRISVNVSAQQFRQPKFVDEVLQALEHSGANPQRLKFELTESLLLHSVEEVIEKMERLRASGVGFELDDFGTGYSSLSYLKRLPLDQLKIDRAFVRDVLTDPNDAAIARTIVALAQALGLTVIAEGVETIEQKLFLESIGCNNFQGYLFSRPLPLVELEKLPYRL